VISWNAGAEALLGYTMAEAMALKCGQILQAFYPTGEPLCSVLCEGRSCIAVGKKWALAACRIRRKDGEMVNAGISTMVLPPEARNNPHDDAIAIVFLREAKSSSNDIPPLMPLRIFTMGQFSLAIAGEGLQVESWKRKQAAVVLKILVSHLGRPVHRERLIEWLWPEADVDRGWERLKVTISFLRSKLKAGGASAETIETVGQSYLLRRDAVWIDSDAFCSLVQSGWDFLKSGNLSEARTQFEEAESLYRGDYLEAEPYAEWCAEERERLREMYLELLSGMVKCYSDGGLFMEASRVCRAALQSDPCRESFLRALLECLVKMGRPDWAVAYFNSWKHSLDREYGLQPTPETLQAYKHLIGERIHAAE